MNQTIQNEAYIREYDQLWERLYELETILGVELTGFETIGYSEVRTRVSQLQKIADSRRREVEPGSGARLTPILGKDLQ